VSGLVVLAGTLLGVASRVEETTTGLSLGLSSDSAWLAAAYLAGATGVASNGALRGAAALTAANGGYYAWIALTEPATPIAVAGPPLIWLLFGLTGGALLGVTGALWRGAGPGAVRALWAAPLATVLIVDGASALAGGARSDAPGLLAGVALVLWSARRPAPSVLVALAAFVAVAATGCLEGLLP